jgi:hypothetical protein
MTSPVLDDYLKLWGGKVVDNSGKVVDKASLLLRSKEHSTAARDQVRKAHCKLERAVYFRQLDVMAWRFDTKGKKDGKKDLQDFKEDLLTKSNEEIFKVYDGDCRDRELIRAGKMPEIPCEQQAASAGRKVLSRLAEGNQGHAPRPRCNLGLGSLFAACAAHATGAPHAVRNSDAGIYHFPRARAL